MGIQVIALVLLYLFRASASGCPNWSTAADRALSAKGRPSSRPSFCGDHLYFALPPAQPACRRNTFRRDVKPKILVTAPTSDDVIDKLRERFEVEETEGRHALERRRISAPDRRQGRVLPHGSDAWMRRR